MQTVESACFIVRYVKSEGALPILASRFHVGAPKSLIYMVIIEQKIGIVMVKWVCLT